MTQRRYPIDPLCTAMGMSLNAALTSLGVSGSTMQQYRTRGVTELVADRLATKAGLTTYTVWPEILQHAIEENRQIRLARRRQIYAQNRERLAAIERDRYWAEVSYRRKKAALRYQKNGEVEREKARERRRAKAAAQRDVKDNNSRYPQVKSQGCAASNPQGADVTLKTTEPQARRTTPR